MEIKNDFRQCIVCEKKYKLINEELFLSLKNFDDACICNECLRKESEGWPKKSQKIAKVNKLEEIFKK